MQKLCIYLKETEPIVTFKSGEHIFPAGIGGLQKLPKEYVSHDANNAFSSMEGHVMKRSLLALARQFYGPGKRGNITNFKKATKSTISLMSSKVNPTVIKFGYISLGKPYFISQIKINNSGNYQFSSDSSFGENEQHIMDFFLNLKNYKGKYTLYEDERFDKGEFLLGFHQDKWYLGARNRDIFIEIDNVVKKLVEHNLSKKYTSNYSSELISIEQTLEFDDRYFRVCAKIIFNYLALKKGQDFVLNECFDPIRNWIINGGNETFAYLTGKKTDFFDLSFPDKAHKLFIIQSGNNLIGIISFYDNNFETVMTLSNNFKGNFELEGFICDWKNKKEYQILEYIILKSRQN